MGSTPEGENKEKKRQKREEASVKITLHKEGEVETHRERLVAVKQA